MGHKRALKLAVLWNEDMASSVKVLSKHRPYAGFVLAWGHMDTWTDRLQHRPRAGVRWPGRNVGDKQTADSVADLTLALVLTWGM